MRTINVVFEDKEYDQLKNLKGDLSWHDFMMEMAKSGKPRLRPDGHPKYSTYGHFKILHLNSFKYRF